MTEESLKRFLMEMAEHAVAIGPRHGVLMNLPDAWRWLTISAARANESLPVRPSDDSLKPPVVSTVNGHPCLNVVGED